MRLLTTREDRRQIGSPSERRRERSRSSVLGALVGLLAFLLAATPVASAAGIAQLSPAQPATAGVAPQAEPVIERADLEFARVPDVATAQEWLNGTFTYVSGAPATFHRVAAGMPIVSPLSKRIYQFYRLTNVPGVGNASRVGVLVRDLADPATIVAGFQLPGDTEWEDFNGRLGEVPHVVDHDGRRIYLWLDAGNLARRVMVIHEEKIPSGLTAHDSLPSGAFTDKTLGLNFGEVTSGRVGDPRQTYHQTLPNTVLQGLTITRGKLYALHGGTDSSTGAPLSLHQLDPDTLEVEWDRSVRACRAGFAGGSADPQRSGGIPILHAGHAVFVPCSASNTAMVVEMPLGGSGSPLPTEDADDAFGTEITYLGSGNPVGIVIDEARQRIHFRTVTALNQSILTFDARDRLYAGSHAVGPTAGVVPPMPLGIDQQTGRVYVQSEADARFGLSLLDGRRPATDPPVTFSKWHYESHPVRVIPRDVERGRLFIVRGTANNDSTDAFLDDRIVVLEDEAPRPIPPSDPPDAATIDVREEAGLTEANFTSDASGYGARLWMPGGFAGLVQQRIGDQLRPQEFNWSNCHNAQREFSFGRVEVARLTTSLQAARAISAHADPGTQLDLAIPSRCSQRPGFGTVDGEPSLRESVAREAEDTAYEDVPSIIADTANNGVPGWVPALAKQYLGPALAAAFGEDDPLASDDSRLIECNSRGSEEGDCWNVRDAGDEQLDRRAGRDWPVRFAACSRGGVDHDRPSFDRDSFADEAQADPLGRPEQDPLDGGLSGFEARSDCRDPNFISSSATAQQSDLSALLGLPDQVPQPAAGGVDEAAAQLPEVTVVHASSSVTERLDPERGVVTVSESLARGTKIVVPGRGQIEIGGAYARAETWAQGRPGTAGSEYTRALWGVRAIGPDGVVHCEFCATEDQMEQLADGLNRVLGDRGKVRIPKPQPSLAQGTPGGYQAAVQLSELERINNIVVNGDGAYEVAAVEVFLLNDSTTHGRQRQIFQLAGTKANSQYALRCAGGAHVEGKQCVLPPEAGGVISVSLVDGEEVPLAGAAFEAIGGDPGTCSTDTEGRCTITGLDPGSYTVKQTQAPDGYLPATETVELQVSSGSVSSARFVNLRNAGTIAIVLAEAESLAPLPGGAFVVFSDDGNGQFEATDARFATCTTDAGGLCLLTHAATGEQTNDVPLGSYLVQQTAAPEGYDAVPDIVPFTLELPGQVAGLGFTNARSGAGGGGVLPNVSGGQLGSSGGFPVQSISTADSGGSGGPAGFIQDVFDEFRNFLLRSPGEAILFGASLILFSAPFWASWRRRQLLGASSQYDA